jgi:hypothetical protein
MGIEPGAHRIKVNPEHTGYVEQFYDNASRHGEAQLVFVRGSEGIEGIDFGLTLGATIVGVVRDSETQLPVTEVEVYAALVDGNQIAWATPDAEGRYKLRGVPAGPIVVGVHSATHVDASKRIEVAGPGQEFILHFALSPGATISGRITDADTGRPIAGVSISADNDGGGPGAWGDSDVDGAYTLKGVAPGTYRISARDEGGSYIQQFFDGAIYWNDARLVAVSGLDDVAGIDFAMQLGATISGRVLDGSTGLPIRNMEIHAGPQNNNHLAWANTREDGTYVLSGIPDGLIEVVVSGRGYVEVRRTVKIRDGRDVTNFDF